MPAVPLGHVPKVTAERSGSVSVMPTLVAVTLPVLRTTKENVTVSPTEPLPVVTAPDLETVSAGPAVMGTVAGLVLVTAAPTGGVPVPVAVFATEPASTSLCLSVYVAVAVTDCPGASVPAVPDGHVP